MDIPSVHPGNEMNKYNVKAIRDELDKYVSNRSWKAFRKKFRSLLPHQDYYDGISSSSVGATDSSTNPISPGALKEESEKLDLCRAVVELNKKQRSRMTDFTETFPSLLHDLCHKFQSKSSSWHQQHNRPPPVPCDILEMVTSVASRKTFVAQYGKRKQTPLALLLEHHPPAYLVERLLAIMTRREEGDTTEEDSLQVLYLQDSGCDTPLSQTIKRLPEADEIVELLLKRDNATLKSLLIDSRSGNIPLYYQLHRELKELRYEGEVNESEIDEERKDFIRSTRSNLYQGLPPKLLYILFKTQRAVLLKQGLLCSEVTDPEPPVVSDSIDFEDEDEASTEGLFRHPSADKSFDRRSDDNIRAMQATICCAHRLSNAKDLTKLISILLSNLLLNNTLDAVDGDGNNFLHWICLAEGTSAFLDTQRGCLNRNVVSLILKHLPLALETRNGHGELPLHIAIRKRRDWQLIRRLLMESPKSARIRMSTANRFSDHQEQLPLHIALSLNDSPTYETAEILELRNAFPEAAIIADPVTRLLPFQLAAVAPYPSSLKTKRGSSGAKKSRKGSKKQDIRQTIAKQGLSDMEHLSTIYSLLRGSPDALLGFYL